MRLVAGCAVAALCLLGCSSGSARLGGTASATNPSESAWASGGSGALPSEADPSATSPVSPPDEPVELATGEGEFRVEPDGRSACITYFNIGTLIADPETGTAAQGIGDRPDGEFGIRPLIWPIGYTARRLAGGEIEVLNGKGEVIATTGRIYQFWTGNWGTVPSGARGDPVHAGGPGCVNEWSP